MPLKVIQNEQEYMYAYFKLVIDRVREFLQPGLFFYVIYITITAFQEKSIISKYFALYIIYIIIRILAK